MSWRGKGKVGNDSRPFRPPIQSRRSASTASPITCLTSIGVAKLGKTSPTFSCGRDRAYVRETPVLVY
jgi:hypothetical protein